jgi:hypothetical protein
LNTFLRDKSDLQMLFIKKNVAACNTHYFVESSKTSQFSRF